MYGVNTLSIIQTNYILKAFEVEKTAKMMKRTAEVVVAVAVDVYVDSLAAKPPT
jgi:hypothetical protein